MNSQDDVLRRLKEKIDNAATIEDPTAAVVEPEIRSPAQYALLSVMPDDED